MPEASLPESSSTSGLQAGTHYSLLQYDIDQLTTSRQLSSILPLLLILAQSLGCCFSSLFLHLQHPVAEPAS